MRALFQKSKETKAKIKEREVKKEAFDNVEMDIVSLSDVGRYL
jgi:hypothetical protein